MSRSYSGVGITMRSSTRRSLNITTDQFNRYYSVLLMNLQSFELWNKLDVGITGGLFEQELLSQRLTQA